MELNWLLSVERIGKLQKTMVALKKAVTLK